MDALVNEAAAQERRDAEAAAAELRDLQDQKAALLAQMHGLDSRIMGAAAVVLHVRNPGRPMDYVEGTAWTLALWLLMHLVAA